VATATLRGGSPVIAALSVTHDTLDERRLVGTDAPDLRALAGARSGTVGATLRTWRQEIEPESLENQNV
jgi:hypothetical protein